MKIRFFLILALSFGQLWSTSLHADSATERMNRFFNSVTTMTADFSQSVKSENKTSPEQSTGTLQMERPGKFRWNYKKPYEQQFVADGKKLWVYDVEMEQVIVKSEDLALGNTPAILLSGNASITDKFEVTEEIHNDSGEKEVFWVQLLPKDKDTGFEKLIMGFAGERLQFMELRDTFGQVTRLTFSNLKVNQSIDPAVFKFNIPKGIDVIDETKAKE